MAARDPRGTGRARRSSSVPQTPSARSKSSKNTAKAPDAQSTATTTDSLALPRTPGATMTPTSPATLAAIAADRSNHPAAGTVDVGGADGGVEGERVAMGEGAAASTGGGAPSPGEASPPIASAVLIRERSLVQRWHG